MLCRFSLRISLDWKRIQVLLSLGEGWGEGDRDFRQSAGSMARSVTHSST